MERKRGSVEQFWFWRKWTWAVYLMGLPFIVWMFFLERDWIFASIEIGGIPAMLCGLVVAFRRKNAPNWLNYLAIIAIPIGLALSAWDFGGISLSPGTQLLEILGSAGFLVGTLLLAKDYQSGYYWFMLMNVSTGILLGIQGNYLMFPQQILSVALIYDAHRIRRRWRLEQSSASL